MRSRGINDNMRWSLTTKETKGLACLVLFFPPPRITWLLLSKKTCWRLSHRTIRIGKNQLWITILKAQTIFFRSPTHHIHKGKSFDSNVGQFKLLLQKRKSSIDFFLMIHFDKVHKKFFSQIGSFINKVLMPVCNCKFIFAKQTQTSFYLRCSAIKIWFEDSRMES